MQGPTAVRCCAAPVGDAGGRASALRLTTTPRGASPATRQGRSAMRVAAEVGSRPAACQSGTQRAVEERARQQRQHHSQSSELQRREAVAATVSHAYRAAIEQRERQRRAAAEEQAQQRAQWAAAAAATAGSRHGTNPAARGRTPFSSTHTGDSTNGARGSSPITRAANSSGFDTSRGRDAHFWMLYALHYRRLYGGSTPADADDCWGRMVAASAAAAADGGSPEDAAFAAAAADGASAHSRSQRYYNHAGAEAEAQQQQGSSGPEAAEDREHSWACEAASSAYAYWRDFARQAAAGFGFSAGSSDEEGTGGAREGDASQAQQQYQQQRQQQQYQQQQQQQQYQQQQQQYQQQYQQQQYQSSPWSPPTGVPPAGASVEQQVRAELAALLAASGGDLARFVSALGIPFERGPDSLHTLKNARRAAMLSLHPDRLLQQGARQQAWGHHATTLVNKLWRASVAS